VASSFDFHVDGWHDPHSRTSGDVGLVVLYLLTDAQKNGGGGTVFAADSVGHVTRLLERGSVAAADMHLADAKNEGPLRAVLRLCSGQEVEFEGRAGDVALCHPFLLHRGAVNYRSDTARILGVQHCPLSRPLRRRRRGEEGGAEEELSCEELSCVELCAIESARRCNGGSCAIA
jgi:hypothetical protein